MKKKLLAAIVSAACLMTAVGPSYTAMADGQKVVTLGADLTQEQKDAILRYFGVYGQSLQTLIITNTDERNHLGSYVPLEQIGSHTYSCALVSPTTSGGIQVKTANLSWVTSNMIASTLSTSGVVNCDVLAAAPFEVSGTGALTGILMAYESAMGITLDQTKKDVATQELITTTNIANNIGQIDATEIVNDTKIQIIEGNVINDAEIELIINEVADEQGVELSLEDREMLAELMKKIAEQEYDYEEMKETLERVETNLEQLSAEDEEDDEFFEILDEDEEADLFDHDASVELEGLAEDSILLNTDDSALGTGVIFDATDTAALTDLQADSAPEDEFTFEISTSDTYDDEQRGDISIADDSEDFVELSDGDIADLDIDDFDEDIEGGLEDISVEAGSADEMITADEIDFSPSIFDNCIAGENHLTVFINRDQVTAGTGTVEVYTADGSLFESVNMNDTSKVVFKGMSDSEKENRGWGTGMKASIYLSKPLAQSSEYFVVLSENAVMTADGSAHSEAITNEWYIETSEYGVFLEKKAPGVSAGDTLNGRVMMDGTDAVYAEIIDMDGSLSFDTTEFELGADTFKVTFNESGKAKFTVDFYDEEGGYLESVDCSVKAK